jgi:hypothetical protein
VTTAGLRRRVRNRLAGHDVLEALTTALGVAFLVGAAVCAAAVVVSIAHLGQPEPGFEPTPGAGSSDGFLEATRWFAIALFALGGVVTGAVGWFLAGPALRRARARLRRQHG